MTSIDAITVVPLLLTLLICPRPPSIVFYIETTYLICGVKQMSGFCVKCNIREKRVSLVVFLLALNLFDGLRMTVRVKMKKKKRITIKINSDIIFSTGICQKTFGKLVIYIEKLSISIKNKIVMKNCFSVLKVGFH